METDIKLTRDKGEHLLYYVPIIEEFHVGFEIEHLYKDHPTIEDGWHPLEIEKDTRLICWQDYINEGRVLVKYLDREDIESLDWNYVPDNYRGDGRWFDLFDGFEGYNLAYWGSAGSPRDSAKIHFQQIWDYKLLLTYNGRIIFEGTIKNKSQLNQTLQLTGVIQES